MLKIVAIGGGEIGRPGFPIETTQIDKEIIRLTGKNKPRLLFIPTASSDSETYYEVVQKYFGKKLGCKVDVLYLTKQKLSKKVLQQKILNTDIIYVGGGNTLKMMNIWRRLGVDKLIKQASRKGIVLSGVSAGSICWFKNGCSDSRKFTSGSTKAIKVAGLELINALHCPHYDFEKNRKNDLKNIMKKTTGVAIALDNCCAIEIVDKNYRILCSKKNAKAYKCYWKNGTYHEEEIPKQSDFSSHKELLEK